MQERKRERTAREKKEEKSGKGDRHGQGKREREREQKAEKTQNATSLQEDDDVRSPAHTHTGGRERRHGKTNARVKMGPAPRSRRSPWPSLGRGTGETPLAHFGETTYLGI